MPTEIAIALLLFAGLVVGSLLYTIVRLFNEPPPKNISPKAQRLARLFGTPKLLDGLFARPMTGREKIGWVVFAFIVLVSVVFTGKR